MDVLEYLRVAESTDFLEPKDPSDPNFLIVPIIGLAGEIGSLLTELKKNVLEPDRARHVVKSRIDEELGDIVWYTVTVARRVGLEFQKDVLLANLERTNREPAAYLPLFHRVDEAEGQALQAQQEREAAALTFGSYQRLAGKSALLTDYKATLPYLAQIWKNSGELFGRLDLSSGQLVAADRQTVVEALGDVMWYVAAFATLFDSNLDDILKENLRKALSMFPPLGERQPTPLFDDQRNIIKHIERFPERFDVDFLPVNGDTAVMLVNGLQIGDPLRDNAYQLDVGQNGKIDGYRFHDCVHFAFVAVLGWSPVMRALMKRKRKTNDAIDDAEDGARARIVEEMIVKLTHSYAVSVDRTHLLKGRKRVSMDLLKQVQMLAEGLEVTGSYGRTSPCKLWEWERAILLGYELFDQLREHGGGRIRVDLRARTATFSPLREGEGGQFPLPP